MFKSLISCLPWSWWEWNQNQISLTMCFDVTPKTVENWSHLRISIINYYSGLCLEAWQRTKSESWHYTKNCLWKKIYKNNELPSLKVFLSKQLLFKINIWTVKNKTIFQYVLFSAEEMLSFLLFTFDFLWFCLFVCFCI